MARPRNSGKYAVPIFMIFLLAACLLVFLAIGSCTARAVYFWFTGDELPQ
jgi:hypothetical protein